MNMATMRETPVTIRVLYCGGCNPEIDRGALVKRLKEIFQAAEQGVVFVKDGDADLLLLINGCPRACLEEENPHAARSSRCVCVEGGRLNHRPVAESGLPLAVWEAIKDIAP